MNKNVRHNRLCVFAHVVCQIIGTELKLSIVQAFLWNNALTHNTRCRLPNSVPSFGSLVCVRLREDGNSRDPSVTHKFQRKQCSFHEDFDSNAKSFETCYAEEAHTQRGGAHTQRGGAHTQRGESYFTYAAVVYIVM